MKRFQAIRLYTRDGRPTYGDEYRTITVPDTFSPDYHEIYTTGTGEKVMFLFEMDEEVSENIESSESYYRKSIKARQDEAYELQKDSNVRDWYVTNFPDDDLGNRISDITFSDVYNGMKDAKEFYDLVGVYDSVIRERVFGALADIYKIDVNTIYDLWQAAGQWSRGEWTLREFRKFVKDLNASTNKIYSSVDDDDLFIVCERCLEEIESREGHQATTKDIPESRLYEVDEYNEYSGETYPEVVGVCDWCEEEYPEDELVRIL